MAYAVQFFRTGQRRKTGDVDAGINANSEQTQGVRLKKEAS
jgi:hypothetical protein